MVGKTGFEPVTPWSQTKCSTKLSHFPIYKKDGKFYRQHCDLGQVEFLRLLRLVTKNALSLQNYDMGSPLI